MISFLLLFKDTQVICIWRFIVANALILNTESKVLYHLTQMNGFNYQSQLSQEIWYSLSIAREGGPINKAVLKPALELSRAVATNLWKKKNKKILLAAISFWRSSLLKKNKKKKKKISILISYFYSRIENWAWWNLKFKLWLQLSCLFLHLSHIKIK